VKRRCYLVRLIVFVNYEPKFNCDDIAIHIYAFRCSVLLPPPSSKYFGTCVLNTFFGWVLVLVLKILLKSILSITVLDSPIWLPVAKISLQLGHTIPLQIRWSLPKTCPNVHSSPDQTPGFPRNHLIYRIISQNRI